MTEFSQAAEQLLAEVQDEIGWMYETLHEDGKTKAKIEYTVWSEVFTCPECTGEIIFLNEALDMDTKRVKEIFPCPHCNAEVTKKNLLKLYVSIYDQAINEPARFPKRVPCLICYKIGKIRYEKVPDQEDYEIIEKIRDISLPIEIPQMKIPYMHMTHERARMDRAGVKHIHHFFLPRAAQALGLMWKKAKLQQKSRTRQMMIFFVEQAIWGLSILNRYQPIMHGRPGGSQVNRQMTGVYYVPSQIAECSPFYNLENRLKRLPKAFINSYSGTENTLIGTSSTTSLQLQDESIDYVFTDPPFGENIYYADLNYLVESWYGVTSNAGTEAIVDKAKEKGLPEYQELMRQCFAEYHRVLNFRVEASVTRCLPHRSVRAEFPHTVPQLQLFLPS